MQFRGNWDTYIPLMEFSYNNSYQSSIWMPLFETLYKSKCKTSICWDEVGEKQLLGLKIIQSTNEKINVIGEKLNTMQDKQKSYVDKYQRLIDFEVGNIVFLRIYPWKGILRFGKCETLSPRYIDPYEIIQHACSVAYRLDLPPELSRVHYVFHVLILQKYISNPSYILDKNQFSQFR